VSSSDVTGPGSELFASPPSFFVIGAQKAGTSSIHAALARLDEVSLPSIKETHFFSKDDCFERGWSWYRSWFDRDAGGRVCGEVDPAYLYSEAAARRIQTEFPRARIVVVLREPLARAWSHYRMSVSRGYETLPFPEALAHEAERLAGDRAEFSREHHGYLARSRYVEWLRTYASSFPREQLLVLRFEELVDPSRSNEVIGRLLEHIGIERPFALELEHHNPGGATRSKLLNRLLYGDSRIKRLLRPIAPLRSLRLRVALRLDRWNRRTAGMVEPLDPAGIEPQLLERIRTETEELQGLLDWNLAEWLE